MSREGDKPEEVVIHIFEATCARPDKDPFEEGACITMENSGGGHKAHALVTVPQGVSFADALSIGHGTGAQQPESAYISGINGPIDREFSAKLTKGKKVIVAIRTWKSATDSGGEDIRNNQIHWLAADIDSFDGASPGQSNSLGLKVYYAYTLTTNEQNQPVQMNAKDYVNNTEDRQGFDLGGRAPSPALPPELGQSSANVLQDTVLTVEA